MPHYFAVQVHYAQDPKGRRETILTTLRGGLAAEYGKRHHGEGLGFLRIVRVKGEWPETNNPDNPRPYVNFVYPAEAQVWASAGNRKPSARTADGL
jgi:hypothetical protein